MKQRFVLTLLVFFFILVGASCRKRVASAPPPPPAVQPVELPPAVPLASLTADRTTIDAGQGVTLQWQTENADTVVINELGRVDTQGSAQVSPQTSISYTLTATGPGGTATDVVRITVNTPPAEPVPAPAHTTTLDEDFLANIQDVFFDYDRSALRPDQLSKIDILARWLREHPGTQVMIEGHCDERGNTEYNLGLGDRRAAAIREHLEISGIGRNRLETVSYGEERPVCTEPNEACWSRNRRAHFVLASTS